MEANNQKKQEQLGMPIGTAANRLRKKIIFHLLQQVGQDLCFKCNRRIEAVEDLSIEHKIPWQDNDINLYWDIENIAFSHLRCNRPSKQYEAYAMRRDAPDGKHWCSDCKTFKLRDEFYRRHGNPDYRCKACMGAYNKQYSKTRRDTKNQL